MIVKIFKAIDDLDWQEKRLEVDAVHTVRFTWQIDGEPVQRGKLDLSEQNTNQVDEDMQRLLHADHSEPPADQIVMPPGRRNTPLAKKKERKRRMKEWVDRNHIRARSGPDRPAYETEGGNRSWPVWLEDKYAEEVEGQPHRDRDTRTARPLGTRKDESQDARLHGDRAGR
jgi:hypothetical protein